MVQQEQVRKTGTDVTKIPAAEPQPPRSRERTIIGGLAVVIAALLVFIGWTYYQRSTEGDTERPAANVPVAWDLATPRALVDVYAPDAVVVDAAGTKFVGIKAIIRAAKDLGPTFSMTQVGEITTSTDGSYATTAYRFSGNGRGSGISVLKIADGMVVRQWNFDTPANDPGSSK